MKVAVSIILIFAVNFAIQPVQGGIRALIVDNCPSHQQQVANAWASRISGIANVISYLTSFLNLPQYLSYFGDTQFKNLSVLASFGLAITLTVSYVIVDEKTLQVGMAIGLDGHSAHKAFGASWRQIRTIPTQIKVVYMIQFIAWIGWFPYLFYLTT